MVPFEKEALVAAQGPSGLEFRMPIPGASASVASRERMVVLDQSSAVPANIRKLVSRCRVESGHVTLRA
jgi:hypothetical protein